MSRQRHHRKHRLLFTISEFIYSSQVRNLCDLVSRLDRDVFDIHIGALAVGDEATADVEALDVPYFRLRLQPTRPIRARDVGAMLVSPWRLWRGKYDLVHSLLYQSIFTEAWFVKHLAGARYVYTKSNLAWDNHPAQWHRKSRLTDRIISISDATSELLAAQGYADRTDKIYLGIDTDHFRSDPAKGRDLRAAQQIPDTAFVFGCAAQFVEWKEHLTVVKAFETIADRRPDAYLLFCGPNHKDAYYQDCLAYIGSSRHAARIRLLGRVADMPQYYSAIDAFVLASRYETFGYVYVEAMSCNRPVIACRAAGPLEIVVENRTGLFCRMSDPQDLSIQMSRYIDDPQLLAQHGEAARQRAVDVFSKEAMAAKCSDLYLRVLEAG